MPETSDSQSVTLQPIVGGPRSLHVMESLSALRDCPSNAVLIYTDPADRGKLLEVRPPDSDEFDVLHSGLGRGASGTFDLLRLTSLDWLLVDPSADRRSTSWKATIDRVQIRPAAMRAVGGIDQAYETAAAALMDLTYRILIAGGRVAHDPCWNLPAGNSEKLTIGLTDQLVFILRHLGAFRALYATFWASLTRFSFFSPWISLCKALSRTRRIALPRWLDDRESSFVLRGDSPRSRVGKVTAIIPTIERYDYLPKAIDSLRELSVPPDEILIVDQTPPERRQPQIYETYLGSSIPIRVLFRDRAGQSSARNAAISQAQHDWLLLFEDDTEAWPEFLSHHIGLIEATGSSASTGVSLAPWKDKSYIDEKNRFPHVCSVLATGNCLISRSALAEVGGLDHAFDRGSGADNDLGTRLYLAGHQIVFNPEAIQTHYKAPRGGMRIHGAWWRHQTPAFAPFPPPTQVYTVRRLYESRGRAALYFLFFLIALPRLSIPGRLWLIVSGPWRFLRSLLAASRLQTNLGLRMSPNVSAEVELEAGL